MTAVGRRTIIQTPNFWEFWCWERSNKKTTWCHHFYSMKDFNTAQELRGPTFVKDGIYPTALKSCCAVFTASILSFKVPPGTPDYSDGFLKNVTIYRRSHSRSGQMSSDSPQNSPRFCAVHNTSCAGLHPSLHFWGAVQGLLSGSNSSLLGSL